MGWLKFSQWLVESIQSDSLAFQRAINSGDLAACKVYADFIEENNLPHYPGTLEYLRTTDKPSESNSSHGGIWAGRKYSSKDVFDILSAAGNNFLSPANMKFFNSRLSDSVFNGPNGIYFIISNSTSLTNRQREYLVVNLILEPRPSINTADRYFENLSQAKNAAKRLALGI